MDLAFVINRSEYPTNVELATGLIRGHYQVSQEGALISLRLLLSGAIREYLYNFGYNSINSKRWLAHLADALFHAGAALI